MAFPKARGSCGPALSAPSVAAPVCAAARPMERPVVAVDLCGLPVLVAHGCVVVVDRAQTPVADLKVPVADKRCIRVVGPDRAVVAAKVRTRPRVQGTILPKYLRSLPVQRANGGVCAVHVANPKVTDLHEAVTKLDSFRNLFVTITRRYFMVCTKPATVVGVDLDSLSVVMRDGEVLFRPRLQSATCLSGRTCR